MPRLTREDHIDLGGGVREIVTKTYELPEKIFVEEEIYTYFAGHQAYYNLMKQDKRITANEYLDMVLNHSIDNDGDGFDK